MVRFSLGRRSATLPTPATVVPARKYAVNHHHHRSVGFKRADWLLVGGQETRTREPHLIVPQTITKRLGRATKTAHNTELWRLLICDSTAALSQVKTVIVIARTTHPNYATNSHPSNVVICLLSCCLESRAASAQSQPTVSPAPPGNPTSHTENSQKFIIPLGPSPSFEDFSPDEDFTQSSATAKVIDPFVS